jgi:hypothetical protein
MKRLVSLCLVCTLAASLSLAGNYIGIKGGMVSEYSQAGLQVAAKNISHQALIGGQFYIDDLPLIDGIVSVDYSWKNHTYHISGREFPFGMRDLAVTVSAVYPIHISSLTTYVGGGIGSHSISYSYRHDHNFVPQDNGIAIPSSSTFPGYHALVGIRLHVGRAPTGLFIEGRLNRIETPENEIRYSSMSGGIFLSLP